MNNRPTMLLIIDPQVDFCSPDGSLYVNGAHEDMQRLSKFVNDMGNKITDIVVTLDSHNILDISHPSWWEGDPEPFTIITKDDVASGKWRAKDEKNQEWSLRYVSMLEENNKQQLCVWPYHCILGTAGHTIYPELNDALVAWEKENLKVVDKRIKGMDIYTEHYSAIKTEVSNPNGEDGIDAVLVDKITRHIVDGGVIFVAGEALSHCVANTMKDLLAVPELASHADSFFLLRDTTSSVSGFEQGGGDFVNWFIGMGGFITASINLCKTMQMCE